MKYHLPYIQPHFSIVSGPTIAVASIASISSIAGAGVTALSILTPGINTAHVASNLALFDIWI